MTASSAFPADAAERLSSYLATHYIPSGLGTEEEACSIAAINLALAGQLTDRIPDCMSTVIGEWVRRIQDAMPDMMRNSDPWKALLPIAAGTGRDLDDERRRLDLIMEWMRATVLPCVQPVADRHGFGSPRRYMTTADADADADVYAAAAAAYAKAAAAYAAATSNAAYAAAYADATSNAAYAAAYADATAAAAAADAAAAAAWETFDPPGLLARLIDAPGDDDA